MSGAVGQMLGSAVGVAISPLLIVSLVLMLSTPQGRANGILLALGWMPALEVLGAVTRLIQGVRCGDPAAPQSGPRATSGPGHD